MSGRLIRNAQIHLIAFSIPKAPNCASGGQLYGPQLAHEISKKAIVEVESTPIRVTIFLSRSIMIIFRCWINRNHDECICDLLDTRGRCYLRARPARPTLLRSCYNEHSFNFPLRSDLKHEVHTCSASDLHGFSKRYNGANQDYKHRTHRARFLRPRFRRSTLLKSSQE